MRVHGAGPRPQVADLCQNQGVWQLASNPRTATALRGRAQPRGARSDPNARAMCRASSSAARHPQAGRRPPACWQPGAPAPPAGPSHQWPPAAQAPCTSPPAAAPAAAAARAPGAEAAAAAGPMQAAPAARDAPGWHMQPTTSRQAGPGSCGWPGVPGSCKGPRARHDGWETATGLGGRAPVGCVQCQRGRTPLPIPLGAWPRRRRG